MTRLSRSALMLALLSALLLPACGKKGTINPPEGREDAFTYPEVYPKPSTVVPARDPEDD
ncbi:hypothetical protein [Fodinicurvata sediminis]|uniref:hypothetical protein n=1 Tax=Fodinicurvata sediminis TaxID=1121832 RepID=UPI0003B35C14|nr:hypothetical protein [Fodinicurvata sediminis]